MRVNSGLFGNNPQQAALSAKDINSLQKGDVFNATVLNLSQGEVTIKLSGGGTVTARAPNIAGLMVGDECSFSVESKESGQIFVKILKDGKTPNVLELAAKALTDADLPVNERNLGLTKLLMENGVPLDGEKLNKATFGMTMKTMTMDRLVFLLNENIDITEGNLKQLNNNIINREGLTSEIGKLIDGILKLENQDEKNLAIDLLLGKHHKHPVEKNVLEKGLRNALMLDISKGEEKELNKLYQRLSDGTGRLLQMPESVENKGVLESAKNIKEALTFQNEINEYKNYMQIPFVIDGQKGQGDLYVFKDKKSGKQLESHATVLLSLDMANVGHLEAFIVKKKKDVSCCFSLSNPAYIKAFKDNSFELHKLLAQKGLKLEHVRFEPLNGAFNLLRESPGKSHKAETKPKKYTFDMKA